MSDRKRFISKCEYCDDTAPETEVTHFPHLGLNVCDDHVRVFGSAIEAAESKLAEAIPEGLTWDR